MISKTAAHALREVLSARINTADGSLFDASGRVFIGRDGFADSELPAWSILPYDADFDIEAELDGNAVLIQEMSVAVYFAALAQDKDNPGDTFLDMADDIVRAIQDMPELPDGSRLDIDRLRRSGRTTRDDKSVEGLVEFSITIYHQQVTT